LIKHKVSSAGMETTESQLTGK